MIIELFDLVVNGKTINIDNNIDIPNELIEESLIRRLNNIHFKGYLKKEVDDSYLLSGTISGDMILPDDITFITTQELLDKYPELDQKGREKAAAKEYGAVFLMQIGDKLSNGERHDGRAPDYDDWQLNGDIIVYYPVLDIGLELSSMGIRVDEDSLKAQLDKAGCPERAQLPFQKGILDKELPYTIGGGIGQSRICMFFLRRAHIGEVQSSIWTEEDMKKAKEAGINIL